MTRNHDMRLSRLIFCVVAGVMACHDLSPALPTGVADPNSYTTPDAARQQARYARYDFQSMLPAFIEGTGLLTDELMSANYGEGVGSFSGTVGIDSRDMGENPQPTDGITLRLFGEVRRNTQQARHALAKYAPADSAFRGEIYALEGMTDIYMADVFCSGIPLSTVDFEQDFTYTAQFTTQEVYEHAIALFDTAIALAGDSATIRAFARVGRARALLAVGRYADADTVVAAVPGDFQYRLPVSPRIDAEYLPLPQQSSVSTNEGSNGLEFRSSNPDRQDPRLPLVECDFCSLYRGATYYPKQRQWWTIATGVEAALIRAEAAIHRNDPAWLTYVNGVRTNGTFDVTTGSGGPDTVWHAGTGNVAGLAPFADPADDPLSTGKTIQDVRLDLVFQERAFWFFGTGTRQGDLRRLVREYHRPQGTVYPVGAYSGASGRYGADVNFTIEQNEQYNPHFLRCLGREA